MHSSKFNSRNRFFAQVFIAASLLGCLCLVVSIYFSPIETYQIIDHANIKFLLAFVGCLLIFVVGLFLYWLFIDLRIARLLWVITRFVMGTTFALLFLPASLIKIESIQIKEDGIVISPMPNATLITEGEASFIFFTGLLSLILIAVLYIVNRAGQHNDWLPKDD